MPHNKSYWQLLSSVYFYLNEDREAVATLSAAYFEGQHLEASQAFVQARQYSNARSHAENWLRYLEQSAM